MLTSEEMKLAADHIKRTRCLVVETDVLRDMVQHTQEEKQHFQQAGIDCAASYNRLVKHLREMIEENRHELDKRLQVYDGIGDELSRQVIRLRVQNGTPTEKLCEMLYYSRPTIHLHLKKYAYPHIVRAIYQAEHEERMVKG